MSTSYKNQRKSLGLPPAGSAQSLTSTLDGSKWYHGVDGAAMARLTKISAEINEKVDAGTRELAKLQINIGKLLNEARELIPGDRQFGQWREQNTPITNKSTANKLMNLARQIGDGRITTALVDSLPLSTLKELISAPDSVVEAVGSSVESGEVPTRGDVREAVRQAREATEGGGGGSAGEGDGEAPGLGLPEVTYEEPKPAPKAPKAPAQPPKNGPALSDVAEDILAMDHEARILKLDPTGEPPYQGCTREEWAWLVFGLDPTPAYFPNPEIVDILEDALIEGTSTCRESERVAELIRKAGKILADTIKNG